MTADSKLTAGRRCLVVFACRSRVIDSLKSFHRDTQPRHLSQVICQFLSAIVKAVSAGCDMLFRPTARRQRYAGRQANVTPAVADTVLCRLLRVGA